MAKLVGLVAIVSELREERTNLVSQLKHVDAALSVLGKLNGESAPKHHVSAAARRKMSLAQKARWAKVATNGATATAKPIRKGRTMSASARRKIAAAQRARWAKLKAKKAV
jgi:hypothetical protein